MKGSRIVLSLALTLVLGLAGFAPSASASITDQDQIAKQVRHELNMIPYVNAFDYMAFTVNPDGSVTLTGAVTNPVLKSEANNVVKRVEGVQRVDNQIEVLPVSFFDNGLRVRLFRTIYGYPALQKYGVGIDKSIRIIVDNGHVTLIGVVNNQADKTIAGIRAGEVPGVFSVDNQLLVEKN